MSCFGKLVFWALIVPIAASVAFYYALLHLESNNDIVPVIGSDAWWSIDQSKTVDSTELKPLLINVSDAELKDLKSRLQRAKFIDNIKQDHTYGFRSDQLKEIRDYWVDKYDWRKWEQDMNKMNHYLTQIEGIQIHYAIVSSSANGEGGKTKAESQSRTTKTIVLLHGWPSSFIEFRKMAQLLIKPDANESYAGSQLEFEVIIPSLPGYGWSEGAHKPGMDVVAISRIFLKLLARLGRQSYYVHGGDWGSGIAQTMGRLIADKLFIPDYGYDVDIIIKGVHTNFAMVPVSRKSVWCKVFVSWLFPSLFIEPEEYAAFFPLSKLLSEAWSMTGYLHLQATRPDTVAAGLVDSPIGMAAYILEKYSAWTHKENLKREDGGLIEKYTLDELLTNVMVYWFTQSIGSSVRLYKETMDNAPAEVHAWSTQQLRSLPIGVTVFPHEMFPGVKWFIEGSYEHLVHYAVMPKGGHFPALEEPELLSRSIRQFVQAAELHWSAR